jgi:ribosome maturation factor RimP
MRDFKRFLGKRAKIRVHENLGGQKVFIGIIGEATEEAIQLDLDEGGRVCVTFDQISRARLVF